MASILLSLQEVCKALNMTEDQILYLVRTKAIPHNITRDGDLKFADKEVISRIIAAPPAEVMPQPKIDVNKMTKDEIMDVFAAILQAKGEAESKALKTAPAGPAEAPVDQEPRPTKKDMEDEATDPAAPKEEKPKVPEKEKEPVKKKTAPKKK